MKTYRHTGEAWFADTRSIVTRVCRWVIWIGGLETVDHPGWTFGRARLSWRAFHDLPIHRRLLDCLTPISLFGNRVTLHWFGLDVRVRGAYLCIHWRDTKYAPTRLRIYRSPDATPHAAYLWIKGTPYHVIADAAAHQRVIAERDAAWKAEREDRRNRVEMRRGVERTGP